MWTHAVYGTDLYHFIQWFILYSFMGWVVESIYMSFCNRKLTNRGFAFSPFCPIYAVGALSVYGMLRPLAGQYVVLYLAARFLLRHWNILRQCLCEICLDRSGGIIRRNLLIIKV